MAIEGRFVSVECRQMSAERNSAHWLQREHDFFGVGLRMALRTAESRRYENKHA